MLRSTISDCQCLHTLDVQLKFDQQRLAEETKACKQVTMLAPCPSSAFENYGQHEHLSYSVMTFEYEGHTFQDTMLRVYKRGEGP